MPKRFPTLKFAFLEGGVGWACNLYADLIGHWEKRNRRDIENYNPAHTEVLEEAHELVEDGMITEADFRDFVFTNPAELYARTNPDFFTGTAVEDAVAKLMAEKA